MRATAALAAVAGLALPAPAHAHGLVIREDLPVPEWLFSWGAAIVLVLSFAALAALWRTPKLEGSPERPVAAGPGRAITSPAVRALCGAIGVAALALVVWSGLAGTDRPGDNFAPTFVYVVFWLGLVPVSVLLGDVFRAFNPWGALARLASPLRDRLGMERLPYPEWLGRWPAAVGLFAFAWLEIVAPSGDEPRSVALAALAYTVFTLFAMVLFGREKWLDRGEAFSVYFGLFARMAPLATRGRELLARRPLAGLTRLEATPGTVAVVAVMLGTVSFDGFAEGRQWQSIVPSLQDLFGGLGAGPSATIQLSYGLGMAASVGIVALFYRLGIAGVASAGGGRSSRDLARAFAHSLVPIALAYVAAHYVSLLLLQGQAIVPLLSDPLGDGSDYLGTAGTAPDYEWLSFTVLWYLQVALVVLGHVAALVSAHDRALVLYEKPSDAARSQYWMLGVMVGFTTLALWLLSEASRG